MSARLLVIQHIPDDHLNEMAGPLGDAGLVVETWFAPGRDGPPRDLAEYDGVITLGAIIGVNDEPDHAWMPVERKLLERAITERIPTLGICFGSQILASVGGAEVRSNDSHEIGWIHVEMDPSTSTDPLLSSLGPEPLVFLHHHDTFGAPSGGAVLGRTDRANQVVRVGESAWGIQFHLEAGPGAILSWLAMFEDDVRELGGDPPALVAETLLRWKDYRAMAVDVANAFAQLVNGHSAQR
jgi:GMP synthase (glutamine-hydrolysing)